MHLLALLSIIATVPFGLAFPLKPRWDDMRVKHSWDSIPDKWECQGHPPADTTIDLRVALKPHHDNALIDGLHKVSDPRHPKYVCIPLLPFVHLLTCVYICCVTDTVRTCPRSKSPSSSLLIRTHSSSSIPGLRFHPLWSRSPMAGVG